MILHKKTKTLYWLAPASWMAVVSYLMTTSVDAETVSHWPPHTDKVVHFAIFAILAWLWYPAFRFGARWPIRPAVWAGFALAAAYGGFTEWLQTNLTHRTGDGADVLANTLGAATLFLLFLYQRTPPPESP